MILAVIYLIMTTDIKYIYNFFCIDHSKILVLYNEDYSVAYQNFQPGQSKYILGDEGMQVLGT